MQTNLRYSVGIDSFETIRNKNIFYVDRTKFIRDWYESADKITVITRPRRFGKTLTLDMMNCFFSKMYEGRQELFKGLAIAEDEALKYMIQYQGMMPVISISFAELKASSYMAFLMQLSECLWNNISKYEFLLE